jgi:hypothetical protein
MSQQRIAAQTRAGAFDSVAKADRAIRQLLAAGMSQDQLAVVCPAKFKSHFHAEASHTEVPSADAASTLALGGALGATLGGLALVATVITGGAAGVMTAAVLIGGGAIAGGFSDLIVSKGYEQESDDCYKQAIKSGLIVVGIEIPGEHAAAKLAEAQRILDEAGAAPLKCV